MSLEAWCEQLFARATGWLGWPPGVALTTPIPQIEAALGGLIEWRSLRNGGKAKPKADPAAAAESLAAWLRSRKSANG